MKKITKKRIDSTAIVIIEEDGQKSIYRNNDITNEQWDEIVEIANYIEGKNEILEGINEEDVDTELYEEFIQDLIDIMVPEEFEEEYGADKETQKRVFNLHEMEKTERNELADMFLQDFSEDFTKDNEGYVYLKGFSTMLPKQLIENLMDAHNSPEEADYKKRSLVNFWKWLMINPDKHVRTDLFKWIATGQWSITDEGMIISYRNVTTKGNNIPDKDFYEFVTEQFLKIKRWKKAPSNYAIIYNSDDNKYSVVTHAKVDEIIENDNIHNQGNLDGLYNTYVKSPEKLTYTDDYSRTMEIKIGEAVSMPRKDCDNDPNASCSRGLHQKSKAYGMNFGQVALVCLVNPYNVVAVPRGEHEKFRTCEYLPIGIAEKDESGDIIEWEGGTYGIDYPGYTEDKLSYLFDNNQVEILKEAGIISEEIDPTINFRSVFESRNVKMDDDLIKAL